MTSPYVCPLCGTDTSTFTEEQQERHGLVDFTFEWVDNEEAFGGTKKFTHRWCRMCIVAIRYRFRELQAIEGCRTSLQKMKSALNDLVEALGEEAPDYRRLEEE